ncbi:MAG: helix-turn-helix domain-containing protein [Actinomycetota bacterium]|nr:helix-turn-helix domain-containing protein [Actinomycetota bacterium]
MSAPRAKTTGSFQTSGGKPTLRAYTVEQVAEILHVGRDKVYFLLRSGQLRSIKIGKSRRITDEHLAEFVSALEDAGQAGRQ